MKELRYDKWGSFLRPHVVDDDDVGMAEDRAGSRFTSEAHQPLGIGRGARRQHFQSHLAIETHVAGPIDLSHAALGD